MDLRAHISSEASAFADRIAAAVENAIEETKRESAAAQEALGIEIEGLRGRLADAEVQVATLRAERDTARADAATTAAAAEAGAAQAALQRQAHEQVVADLQTQLEASTAELDARVADLEAAEHRAREQASVAHHDAEAHRQQLEAAVTEAGALRQQLETLTAEAHTLRQQLDTVNGETPILRRQLVDAVAETATLRELLDTTVAEAHAQQQQLDAAGAEAGTLRQELEAARARQEALQGEAAAATARLQAKETELAVAGARVVQLHGELAETIAALEQARAEAAGAAGENETLRTQVGITLAETEALRTQLAAQAAEGETHRQQAAATAADRDALRGERDALRQQTEALQQQVDSLQLELQAVRASAVADSENAARAAASDTELVTLRAELEEAQQIADAAGAEMTALRERTRKAVSLLGDTARALAAIDAEGTVDGILGTLARQLHGAFTRAAIFRLHGNHLEGAVAVGVDSSVDVKKIVVPRNLGSLMTRAASGGGLQVASQEAIAEARSPFGGSPASAVAAPLVFQGETLAVVYADADVPFSDAHVPLAEVLVRHSNARLTALAQELKAVKGLREYAQTLVQELEQMFTSDVDGGIGPKDRLRRLRDSIGFARDLYAQRAALEAPTAADFLEEEISALIDTDARTPFTRDLASLVIESRGAARNAS